MMPRLLRSLLSMLVILSFFSAGSAWGQLTPVTPGTPAAPGAAPGAPAQPRPQRAPRPDKPFTIEALDPSLWNLIDKDAQLITMGAGFGFTEGPVWDPAGFVWASDESKNKIFKLYPDGKTEDMVELVDPDGSTYDNKHRLWSTASGLRAIIELSPDGKKFDVVVDHFQGKKLNTPNDIIVGPDGAFYFTDPVIDMKRDQIQEGPETVYRLNPKTKELKVITTEIKRPNGLAFSPVGKYLYVDDNSEKHIHRYDFNKKTATVSNGMDFANMNDPVLRGNPDGMKVDKQGNLFLSGPDGIWVWNSKGVHIGTLHMPHGMANLTWGGADYSKHYITAGPTIYILQTKTKGFLGYKH